MNARRRRLPDGRWHLQHGPIDLIVEAVGDARTVAEAHEAAWRRFETVLDELVTELPLLKRPLLTQPPQGPLGEECPLRGNVARRMWLACEPHRACFVTPMAAVAGAVADEIVLSYRRAGIDRAWVNNGGDVALHLAAGASLRIGLYADLGRFAPTQPSDVAVDGAFEIEYGSRVRGVATSGWRGRSFSLGIADSVTVLAATAAEADAAATMIANAVDVDDPRIVREPASRLKDDSDLGDTLVTVDVSPLDSVTVSRALRAGWLRAEALRCDGLIAAAVLICQGVAMRSGGSTMSPAGRSRIDRSARMPEAA